jgi:uncharacterized protein (TIGR02246 family)
MMQKLITSALACGALAGCATGPAADCGGVDGAAARVRDVIAADNARDLPRVLEYYTADVVWLPPGPRQKMEGIAAIRASYETMYATYAPALTITVKDTHGSGEVISVEGRTGGRLHPLAGGADTVVNDEYIAVLRCESGSWRISKMAWSPAKD